MDPAVVGALSCTIMPVPKGLGGPAVAYAASKRRPLAAPRAAATEIRKADCESSCHVMCRCDWHSADPIAIELLETLPFGSVQNVPGAKKPDQPSTDHKHFIRRSSTPTRGHPRHSRAGAGSAILRKASASCRDEYAKSAQRRASRLPLPPPGSSDPKNEAQERHSLTLQQCPSELKSR